MPTAELRSVARLLLCCAVAALPVFADTTSISTPSAGSVLAYSFGGPSGVGSDTYGQTFTVPAGHPLLSGVSFRAGWNFGGGVTFSGYLMAWNGTQATGPVLYQSLPLTIDSSTNGLQPVVFDVPSVTVVPGNKYVFFLQAANAQGGGPATAYLAVTGSNTSYSGGNFVFTDSGGVSSNLTATAWVQPDTASVYGDAVFEADFSSLTAQTITFSPAVTTYLASAGSFQVSATASSGLTVAFTSTTQSVCTVAPASTTVTIMSSGVCTIQASQAGNSTTYAAASPVSVNFTITAVAKSQPAVITSLSPCSIPALTPNSIFQLHLAGSGMVSGSSVQWVAPPVSAGSAQMISTFPGALATSLGTQTVATIPQALLQSVGAAEVAILNPDGVMSNQLLFTVTPANPTGPVAYCGTIVSAISFVPGAPVAPGSYAAIFGVNLATSTAQAFISPLPATLGGASVTFNGIPAALVYASSGQINVEVPWGALKGAASASVNVVVTTAAGSSPPEAAQLSQFSPEVFTVSNPQQAYASAFDANNNYALAAPAGAVPGVTSQPAHAGDVLLVYASGLGPVNPTPADGAPSPGAPVVTTPVVLIGGVQAQVIAGLSQYAGVYQMNVTVPAIPANPAAPFQIMVGGVTTTSSIVIATQ